MTGIGQNPLGIQPPKRPLGVKSLNEKPIVIQDENETSCIGTLPKVNKIFQFISLIKKYFSYSVSSHQGLQHPPPFPEHLVVMMLAQSFILVSQIHEK